ncbi:succinylglutamate desuccinylase/aspartoacylase family protein [Cohnella sp. GbtcB17]|uniref:succinylglutamate desuccinylase/aspartoacylase family protein n=1 Tax=Cohnella sp. GbtcB17 TaxID=2824762 RepID=UPI001C30397F|nr:succinylglutamate desuccinylase/aspartoacylase family protein [Cohnella sp. GbtcB17]
MKKSSLLKLETGGEPVSIPLLEIEGLTDGPRLLVFAAVHGDEYEGVETILRLYERLSPEELAGSLVMLPIANPYAYRAGARISPDDDTNLARVFPGKPDGTVTERLASTLHGLIAESDFFLDLHSGGTHYAVAALAGYYHDPESAFGRRCRAAAEAFGSPLLWGHERIAPGRSVSSAQALGVPWLYTEAYGGRRIRPEDSDLFYRGALRLMNHLGMLVRPNASELGLAPSTIRTIHGDGNFDESVAAAADGFFIPDVPLLTELRSGDRIGTIRSYGGEVQDEVRASSDGILVMLLGTPIVRKGDSIYLIAPMHG